MLAPDERCVSGDQAGGRGERVESVGSVAKAGDDGEAGFVDVAAADGFVRKRLRDGDGAVEVVGVRGAEGGDGKAGLGEARRELGVCVYDRADGGEFAVEQSVRVA